MSFSEPELLPAVDPKTVCSTCGQVKSRRNFDFGSDGKRTYANCRDCRKKQIIDQAIAAYDKQKQEQLKEFGDALNGNASKAHITQLADGMLAQFGSLNNFCAFWYTLIVQAAASDKKKSALDACNQIKTLIREASEYEQRDKEVKHLTRAEMLKETIDFILWCAESGDHEEKMLARTTIAALSQYGLDHPAEPVAD